MLLTKKYFEQEKKMQTHLWPRGHDAWLNGNLQTNMKKKR
jgi:hypothetical protein